MMNPPYEKSTVVGLALKFAPPRIRESLLSEESLREKYGLKTEAWIAFGPSGVSLQRSKFFNAIRSILPTKAIAEVADSEGRIWNLANEADDGRLPNLVLLSGQQRIILPDFSVLSTEVTTRIRFLDEFAVDVNLPSVTYERWKNILLARPLEDEEVDTFYSDIHDTPKYFERLLQNEILSGKGNLSSLVPRSRRYYERLIGIYDGSSRIQEYAAGIGRDFFKQLIEWNPYDGFLLGLLLSSHSAMTSEINANHIDSKHIAEALGYLEKHGDMLSRLGAIEVGVCILPNRPEIEPLLLRLLQQIRDDDISGKASEFRLFSALFILVDGELARTRLLTKEPPFYRRLASLAHAALIHRQLIKCEVDCDEFYKWAFSHRSEHFYMQSLADMRIEPRWNPDFAEASQLQADFFGRLMIAANNFQESIGDGELCETILGSADNSLVMLCKFPRPYFPGPLEGAENSPNAMPEDLARVIEEQLNKSEVEVGSFIAIVNSAMIFRITSNHAELAAKALKQANYTLANLNEKSMLLGILNGLATVAAVSRSSVLADELRILVRRYRHDPQFGFSINEAIRICLVACAGQGDLTEWCKSAGDWLTELSFGEMEGNEGELFHSKLSRLLHSVPELWISCAKADAALRAWCYR